MPNWKSYESSVRLLSAIVAAHPGLKLNYDEIVRFYGSDCTKSALQNHFNRDLNPNVKSLKEAVDQGTDPKVVIVEGVRGAGQTGKAIAGQLGDGVTDGTPAKATPRKRAAGGAAKTPGSKRGGVKKEVVANDDDEEDGSFGTPSKKKGALNKVAGGRVTKAPESARGKKSVNYHEQSDDEEDADMPDINIKGELDPFTGLPKSNGNGNGFGGHPYSNGHSFPQPVFGLDDEFADARSHHEDEDEDDA